MAPLDRTGFPIATLDKTSIAAAAVAFLVTIALGLILATAFGMPGPFLDDIYFSGPAIRFATTGEMKMFLLNSDGFPSPDGQPFWYAPIQFYALGYWFAAFGCSTVSALCFYAVLAAISSAGASLMLSRFGCAPLWCFGSAILIWTTFYGVSRLGLRPEPLGLAFLFFGLALVPSTQNIPQCLGFFFICLAVITAPRLTGWAIAFGGLFTVAVLNRGPIVLGNAFVGGAAASLLFLVSIRFELATFYEMFSAHAEIRTTNLFTIRRLLGIALNPMIYGFGRFNWLGIAVVLAFGAITAQLSGYRRAVVPLLVTFVLGYALAIPITEHKSSAAFIYITTMGLWGLSASVSKATYLRRASFAMCTVLAGIPLAIIAIGFFDIQHQRPERWSGYRKIEAAVNDHQWQHVWIDSFSLRYVFDMRPPLTAKSNLPNLELKKELARRDPDTIFLLSAQTLHLIDPVKFSGQPGTRVFGKIFTMNAEPAIHFISGGRQIGPEN